jgi:hypothetical protein
MARLNRLRHGGDQYVRIEQIHINDGGQAIIGNVKTRYAPPSYISLQSPGFTDVDELVPGEEPKR